jgi:hypothetical protein
MRRRGCPFGLHGGFMVEVSVKDVTEEPREFTPVIRCARCGMRLSEMRKPNPRWYAISSWGSWIGLAALYAWLAYGGAKHEDWLLVFVLILGFIVYSLICIALIRRRRHRRNIRGVPPLFVLEAWWVDHGYDPKDLDDLR